MYTELKSLVHSLLRKYALYLSIARKLECEVLNIIFRSPLSPSSNNNPLKINTLRKQRISFVRRW